MADHVLKAKAAFTDSKAQPTPGQVNSGPLLGSTLLCPDGTRSVLPDVLKHAGPSERHESNIIVTSLHVIATLFLSEPLSQTGSQVFPLHDVSVLCFPQIIAPHCHS